jgi:hypothetical protein
MPGHAEFIIVCQRRSMDDKKGGLKYWNMPIEGAVRNMDHD